MTLRYEGDCPCYHCQHDIHIMILLNLSIYMVNDFVSDSHQIVFLNNILAQAPLITHYL